MKTFSSISIVALLVILWGFVKDRPVEFTGKTQPTVTQEMIITRKPVITRPPTVTPPAYP